MKKNRDERKQSSDKLIPKIQKTLTKDTFSNSSISETNSYKNLTTFKIPQK